MLAGPKPVDLVEAFALPVPSLVICELLGVPYADHDFFQENSKVLINRQTATAEQRVGAAGELIDYLDDLIGEKLANPGDDLLSGLVGADQGRRADPAGRGPDGRAACWSPGTRPPRT